MQPTSIPKRLTLSVLCWGLLWQPLQADAQGRLKEMVETINNDPPNSLGIMHTKYGQPCDELLVKAPHIFWTYCETTAADGIDARAVVQSSGFLFPCSCVS